MQDQAMKNILEPEALERLNRIQFVKPEKYEMIKNTLLQVFLKETHEWFDLDKNQRKPDNQFIVWNVRAKII